MKTIAIIGAGPMGLAAAYHVARAGHKPVVLEKDDQAGGMSASFDFDGVRLEKYYHFINRPDQDLFALLRELNMEQDLRWKETRMGFFRPDSRHPPAACRVTGPGLPQRGILHPWGTPLALLAFRDVSLLTRLRYGCHTLYCKHITNLMSLDDTPAAEWIRAWVGEEGYTVLWRALFEKKFFNLAEPLSAAWIASRVRRVARSRTSLMREQLGYLEGGSESLIRRLVNFIKSLGGEVRTGCSVRAVTPHNGGFTLYADSGSAAAPVSGSGVLWADTVLSTVPLPYVGGIFPFLPDAYARRAAQVHNIGVACAVVRLQKPISDNFWLNIDMPDWDVPGIIEYSNLRPMHAAYVYVPFYMPHTHPNWEAADTVLLAKVRQYLTGINAEAAATEQAARLFRYEYAQPVCPPGFRHVVPPYATGVSGLYIADTTHSFPEDRSIQESVRIGHELAATAMRAL